MLRSVVSVRMGAARDYGALCCACFVDLSHLCGCPLRHVVNGLSALGTCGCGVSCHAHTLSVDHRWLPCAIWQMPCARTILSFGIAIVFDIIGTSSPVKKCRYRLTLRHGALPGIFCTQPALANTWRSLAQRCCPIATYVGTHAAPAFSFRSDSFSPCMHISCFVDSTLQLMPQNARAIAPIPSCQSAFATPQPFSQPFILHFYPFRRSTS